MVNGKWVNKEDIQNLPEESRSILKQLSVTYVPAKDHRKLVSVLIPNDLLDELKLLADPDLRKKGRVSPSNNYLFASSKQSNDWLSG